MFIELTDFDDGLATLVNLDQVAGVEQVSGGVDGPDSAKITFAIIVLGQGATAPVSLHVRESYETVRDRIRARER